MLEGIRLCRRQNVPLGGLSVCPTGTHTASDFSSMIIARQASSCHPDLFKFMGCWQAIFWCYSSHSQRPRSLVEQCLSLMDVIWTWEGRREALGESLRSEMLPLGACLYPFQGSAFREVVLVVSWHCVLYPLILGQKVQCPKWTCRWLKEYLISHPINLILNISALLSSSPGCKARRSGHSFCNTR